jgi:hypothetical protein
MDTLKDELELAVPRVDPGPDTLDGLVVAGRRAVRRRRVRAGGLLVGGGLVAASLAVSGPGLLSPDDGQRVRDPAVATAPGAPQSSAAPTRSFRVRLSLDTLLEVHGKCGRRSTPERVDEARGDGWSAVEFACGGATVRVLRTPDGGLVDRYEGDAPSTLEVWGEANAEGGGR